MKKISILFLSLAFGFTAHSQVVFLSETFNENCAAYGENYPANWSEYDILSNPPIAWTCAPTEGRGVSPTTTSPGIMCTNYDGVQLYLDTAWLFTPQLNLSFYAGDIYLQFDSKYMLASGRLSVLVSNDYQAGWPPDTVLGTHVWYDATSSISPVLGNVGTSDWTTYVIDLTPFKSSPMYVAFRYTASAAGQGTWIIDNVYTTQTPSAISNVEKSSLSLSVIGQSSPDQMTLSYNVPTAADYSLEIYNMMGAVVYKESINAQPGSLVHTINGLGLVAGMYLVKMGNEQVYNTAKVIVR